MVWGRGRAAPRVHCSDSGCAVNAPSAGAARADSRLVIESGSSSLRVGRGQDPFVHFISLHGWALRSALGESLTSPFPGLTPEVPRERISTGFRDSGPSLSSWPHTAIHGDPSDELALPKWLLASVPGPSTASTSSGLRSAVASSAVMA